MAHRVALRGLSKRYGALAVLERMDLEIDAGEFFGFLGPSGCGKSTLLALVAGIDAPSAGSVRFDDRDVTGVPPQARDVAMVFQSYALYPHLTVRGNLAFPLRHRGVARAQIAGEVERIAEALGITALLDHRPAQLSGGQRQRVALGRALIRRPGVFLMDEPLSNLDARLRLEMRAEIKRLHRQWGITTLYVTHDQEEAMVLCDRIAVLAGGCVQQCGTPAEIYGDPANLFVAQFVGTPPMNVLDAGALAGIVSAPSRSALVGFRPGDVRVGVSNGERLVNCEVLSVEPTGPETWVLGALGDATVKGRLEPGARVRVGERAAFAIPGGPLCFFDHDRGTRL